MVNLELIIPFLFVHLHHLQLIRKWSSRINIIINYPDIRPGRPDNNLL